jgi:hypothetical protein
VLGIAAAWAAGMGLLIKREYFRPTAELLAEAATLVGPSASYYAITSGGAAIGYQTSTVDTTAAGITAQSNTVMDIRALGAVQKIGIVQIMHMSRSLHLERFEAELNSDAAKYKVRGIVEGDSVLVVTIEAGGDPQTQRMPLTRPIVLSELVNLRLAVGGELRPGRTYALSMFDPVSLQQRDVTLRVLAESTMVFPDSAGFDSAQSRWVPARFDTVQAFHVEQAMGELKLESWIDERGAVIEATAPMGLAYRRTAFEIAVQNYRRARERGDTAAAGEGSDVIGTTAISANVQLRPEALAELRVRIGNVSLGGFDLAGGRQRLAGDTLVITRETGIGDGPGGPPPAMINASVPLSVPGDTAIAAALRPEPLVQSNDPRIVAQARTIIGNERRAGRVAELLTRWVYSTLDKKITVSVPSAAQVLATKSGDCNEHTVLYVALARAVGLPARTAAGVVYLRGQFYYHAWPEVWLGQWVAVDPTFGQFPADAAHLRFILGGLARQVELVRLIGRLQLTVVN